jgi:hypothetical protein
MIDVVIKSFEFSSEPAKSPVGGKARHIFQHNSLWAQPSNETQEFRQEVIARIFNLA